MGAITEDELAAKVAQAVADAVGPLEAKIAERDTKISELSDQLAAGEVDQATTQAVADAVAPLNQKVADLQTALDAAEVARGAAENERKALVDWLEGEAEVVAAQDRRETRIAAVKDVGIWPDDTFDETKSANKDRIDKWVDMDEDVFGDLIDGWKVGAPAKADAGNGEIPTKRSALADSVSEGAEAGAKSAVSRVLERSIPSLASQASS